MHTTPVGGRELTGSGFFIPDGNRVGQVEGILFQPEASGDYVT